MELKKPLSRRHFLKYLGAGAASLAAAYSGLSSLSQRASASTPAMNVYEQLPETFNPSLHTAADADQLLLASGFSYNVLAAYGDTINKSGDTLGFNNSYTSFFPIPGSSSEALLWVNHESAQYAWMLDRSKAVVWEQQKQLLYDQGASILHLKKDLAGQWKLVPDSTLAHRISGLTPIELTGPVRGSKSVNGATLVQGTFANRGGGKTLWSTQLTCENRFESTCRDAGLALSHYGWIVEVDPFDKKNKPVKHTALGRFHHGSAAMSLSADKRIVVYMGEDSPSGFVYKFVSAGKWTEGNGRANAQLLSEGTLYAADFIQGRWIELSVDNVRKQLNLLTYQVPENMYKSKEALLKQFQSQSDVLTSASEAALIVGATPCDRPAELTVHPANQNVFIACTQNDSRGNLHGQIIRLKESGGETFAVETFITGGRQSGFSSPGSIALDKNGSLWVASDISADRLNTGAWSEFKNNGLYLIHPTGTAQKTKQYASAPKEAALSGLSFTENQSTVFLAVNHPGALGAGTNKPTSQWPHRAGDKTARSAVVAITGSIW
ncbi:PhoX family protein [Paenibacillus eucommiae]|uniref:Secreted PhoX family phosphatase n=1 Tax=Paenibacillus eucommiae TaxID=1355755 RepID=A0ABS4IX90_9BACL|nr:alkaline phosphatase PhoX [Paenibacillus eucommiae]MBP1991621.1 secreted PhoX family phosphatase [Paenibacillus eucommiae]